MCIYRNLVTGPECKISVNFSSAQQSSVAPWAQFGGGQEGRVPLTFLDGGGHNMPCPPTFFS